MKKKFAFLLMAPHYNPAKDYACFETPKQITMIVSVNTFEEACARVRELAASGVGAIELCGAFGAEKARILDAQCGHKVAIGYVTHAAEQDALFAAFFAR